jgi:hypothetical protein
VQRLPISRRILIAIGAFPIRDHYGEPLFNPRHLRRPLDEPRELPGLDLNVPEQLARLERLRYASELIQLPKGNGDIPPYDFGNPTFGPGDSEYLYSLVRQLRPARVVEVGSGNSTRIALAALRVAHDYASADGGRRGEPGHPSRRPVTSGPGAEGCPADRAGSPRAVAGPRA